MTDACPFCKIVSGRAPASVVFEDSDLIAFMTLRPTRPGEFLIIPKQHIDHFCDVPDDLSGRIMIEAQKYSRQIRERLKVPRVGLVVHGFGVPHAHLIIVPLHEGNDIVSQRHAYLENGEIRFSEKCLDLVERAELDEMAELLCQN